jgi:Tol biopolymer transport system component
MVVIVLVLLAAAGVGSYAWTGRPQLLELYPPAGAEQVPVTSPIRLEFSRSMKPETVISHLKFEPAMGGEFSWDKNTLTFTPDKAWPNEQEISLQLEAGARAASWLSFPMEGESWTFKTSVSYLAYLWPSEGPADIYGLNPVTGEIIRYTQAMGVSEYTLSSDGMMIYFAASNAQGGSDLYQMDRLHAASLTGNGYKPQELLVCGLAQCRSPAVSFDGTTLAYEYLIPTPKGGLGPAQIWLLSLPSLEASPVGQATHETVQPGWSASGWLAYYDRTSSTYEVINPLTQRRTQLANQTGQPGNWSPDGEYYLAPEIYYSQPSGNVETGSSHLLRYGIQTGIAEDISGVEAVEDVEGIYSPDGGSIALARKFLDVTRWSLGRQIWLMNPDGSNPHPITTETDYNHYDLAWSRDGMMVAYVRFNQAKLTQPPELWMINVDGSNPLQLVIGGYSPQWIP